MPVQSEGWERVVLITTPEGVEVRLPAAGIGTRSLAFLVDYMAYSIVASTIAGLLVNLIALGSPDVEAAAAATLAVAGLLTLGFLAYHAGCVAFARGQTLGKKLLRIRVVRDDGGAAGFGRAMARTLMLFVDGLFLGAIVGGVSMLFSSRHKRLGDLVAGTLVVREAEQPHGLTRRLWLTGIPLDSVSGWDTSALDGETARVVEDFLGRRLELAPASRRRLSELLAARVRMVVPGIPAVLHPEAALEGVALSRWFRTAPTRPSWVPSWAAPGTAPMAGAWGATSPPASAPPPSLSPGWGVPPRPDKETR